MTDRICSVDECERPAVRRGWCSMHYLRWYRESGKEALAAGLVRDRSQRQSDPVRRFFAHVSKTDTCWLWAGDVRHGYGRFSSEGRSVAAHRFSYELHVGPIPDGLQMDHLCRVRNCVNPAHLEPVTASENVRRALPWRRDMKGVPKNQGGEKRVVTVVKTHCKQGHEFDEANTYHYRGKRFCRACDAARKRRRYSLDAM